MGIRIVSDDEKNEMKSPLIQLVDPNERHTYQVDESKIFYRRRSFGDYVNGADLTVSCIIGWENVTDIKGNDVPFSKELFNKLDAKDVRRFPRLQNAYTIPDYQPDESSILLYRRLTPTAISKARQCSITRGKMDIRKLYELAISAMLVGWENVCDINGQQKEFYDKGMYDLPFDAAFQLISFLLEGVEEEVNELKNYEPTLIGGQNGE